jgi:predicted DNA-binding transcriptional regulator AlpA
MARPKQEPVNVRPNIGLLTEADVAVTLGLDPDADTLATWRSKKFGPPHIKLGKSVFYLGKDLAAWIAEQAQRQRAE